MKKKTELKAFLIASTILHFTFYTLHSYAATINQVIVRQQWPWSKDVKVEYSLTGVDASHPVDLTVTAYNGDTPLTIANPQESIKGDLYGITEEFGEFYIDPVAAFGSERIAMTKFKVKLVVSDSAANVNEVLYKIFCLTNSNEEVVNVTRADFLNGKYGAYETDFGRIGSGFNTTLDDVLIWTDVTNNPAYKTTHLVMRKVSAKDVLWKIGSPLTEFGREADSATYYRAETQHIVKVTYDYFIGVFEVTQRQYEHIMDSNPSQFQSDADASHHPVEQVSYATMRGGRDSSANGEKICWPTNSYRHLVSNGSFCGKLRTKFGVDFDLPTEAMWEFACRAGTTNSLYSGRQLVNYQDGPSNEIAWNSGNAGGKTHGVGLKKPNAFGLYDMCGNVMEQCLDWSINDINVNHVADPLVNPDGGNVPPTTRYARQVRGSCYSYSYKACRPAFRGPGSWADDGCSSLFGFRLAIPVAASWED